MAVSILFVSQTVAQLGFIPAFYELVNEVSPSGPAVFNSVAEWLR
jgi:hypothetical protein